MRARPTIAIVAATSVLALASAVAPASATNSTVSDITELTTALADCTAAPNTVVLGADILAATSVSIPCDTTIDLGIFDLTLLSITIDAGRELTITGPTDGSEGTLTANASSVAGAGISTTNATLRVTGGSVHATGGFQGAGIGGSAFGQSGGALIIEGGSVTAVSTAPYGTAVGGANGLGIPGGDGGTVTLTGGSLTASSGQAYGAAIGGGGGSPGGAGATIIVNGGVLTAVGSGSGAATVGGGGEYDIATGAAGSLTIGSGGTAFLTSGTGTKSNIFGAGPVVLAGEVPGAPGSIVVNGDLYLPAGILRMPAGTSVTVGSTGRLLGSVATPTVGASFLGPATITNSGVIALSPAGSLVTGNNRLLTFSDSQPSVRVFAPTIDAGFRSLPTAPTDTAWNTAADGTGTWFSDTDSTSGAGTTALFAAGLPRIAVSAVPADLIATVDEPFTFPVTVLGSTGAAASPQPVVAFTSSNCTFSAAGVFDTVGVCSITATSTWATLPVTATFDIQVRAAAPPAVPPATLAATGADADGGVALAALLLPAGAVLLGMITFIRRRAATTAV